MHGIKTNQNGTFCAHCDAGVIDAYNFCPKCGSPLNIKASKLRDAQNKGVKIDLLDQLAYEIQDEKSLKIIIEKLKTL